MVQILFAGIALGTISSFHCVGMCGPLALALPVQDLSGWQKSLSLLLYHSGRILVYAGLGLVFGLAGRGLYLAGYQQWFSVGLGVLMLAVLVQYLIFKSFPQPALIRRFNRGIQIWVMKLWKTPSKSS